MGDYNDAFLRNNSNNATNVQARTKAINRANVMQLKLIGQSHPTGLTANLLKLFEPRPPLEFKPPPEKRKCLPYTGMAQFVNSFAEPTDPEYAPPVEKAETPAQRRARVHKLRLEEGARKAAEELEKYDPNNDPNISGDPYKTLFVARLNYETTESKIKREFEAYGPIKRADGRKLDNRRVLVDVERGRTVPNWRPRRLGGGLGTTRICGEELDLRELQQSGGPSRSEEPRIRDDRDREREKSRERVKEREKSRERSHDRPRDRDREDRHHRDRDRTRDRERERDRTRDRDRARSHDRDRARSHDRDRGRDRDRHRDRDYDDVDRDRDRGRSRDRDYVYDRVEPKHERDRHGERGRKYDHDEVEDDGEWYDQAEHGHRRQEAENEHGYYDNHHDGYDRMDDDDYGYGREAGREKDRDHRRSERSLSREYE